MEQELDSALVEYHRQAQNLISSLAAQKRTKAVVTNWKSATDSLMVCNSRIVSGLNALKIHQKAVADLLDVQHQIAEAEEELRKTTRDTLEGEESLAEAINQAEALIANAPVAPATPEEIVRYACFVAPTTSAPPEWRPYLADERVLPPNPQPREIFLPPPADFPNGSLGLIPSMVHVSWLKPDFNSSERGGTATAKRAATEPRIKREIKRQTPAPQQKKPTTMKVMAGFSDDDDSD